MHFLTVPAVVDISSVMLEHWKIKTHLKFYSEDFI